MFHLLDGILLKTLVVCNFPVNFSSLFSEHARRVIILFIYFIYLFTIRFLPARYSRISALHGVSDQTKSFTAVSWIRIDIFLKAPAAALGRLRVHGHGACIFLFLFFHRTPRDVGTTIKLLGLETRAIYRAAGNERFVSECGWNRNNSRWLIEKNVSDITRARAYRISD